VGAFPDASQLARSHPYTSGQCGVMIAWQQYPMTVKRIKRIEHASDHFVANDRRIKDIACNNDQACIMRARVLHDSLDHLKPGSREQAGIVSFKLTEFPPELPIGSVNESQQANYLFSGFLPCAEYSGTKKTAPKGRLP